ncbi:MAG: hypothetical protein AAFZ49_10195 [Cyanobacteria bacterium J06659_2]
MSDRSSWKAELGGLVFSIFLLTAFGSGAITFRQGRIELYPARFVALGFGFIQAAYELVISVRDTPEVTETPEGS